MNQTQKRHRHLRHFTFSHWLTILILLVITSTGWSKSVITSPNGKLQVTLSLQDNQPTWQMSYNGKTYLNTSQLGVQIDGKPLGAMRSGSTRLSTHREHVKTVWGKFAQYDNHYTQCLWPLREIENAKRSLAIEVRVYNQGVALRYKFGNKGNGDNWGKTIKLTDGQTEFRFAGDYTGWAYNGERNPLGPQPLSRFHNGRTKGARLPLTIQCDEDVYLAVLEASIFDLAPFTLKAIKADHTSFRSQFAASTLTPGSTTSWRVILVGNQPGDLLTSPVMFCLNPPCQIDDPSWIKPGLAMWDWRAWGAKTEDGFTYSLDMASWKRFIDFASKHNVRYLVLDANWYGNEFDPKSDPRQSRDHLVIQPDPNSPNIIRKPAPKNWKDPIDIPALIKYGNQRNVGIILYFNDIARNNYPFEETLALYQKWGAAGIKYGFMKGKGQQKVLDTRTIAKMCARYQLLCDFHDGPVPPSGDRRTFPNHVTREFCHSQSDAMRVFSPSGFCEQVFVNMLAGPLDMCNGMYTLKNPRAERPKIFKNIDTTVVAETARVMIVFSGLSILPDSPEAYEKKADLFDFLSKLPMTWDETRILHGQVGKYITTARRNGSKWFIASANNEQKRTLPIKLDFLTPGTIYSATLYEDAPEAHYQTNREAYRVRQIKVKQGDTINANMAPGGGHCIYLEPVK